MVIIFYIYRTPLINDSNQYYQELKCINLTDKFNEVQGIRQNIGKMNNYYNEYNKSSNKEENENYMNKSKNFNFNEYKKLIFDEINDDNSCSIKDNINENINAKNENDKYSENTINITIESSSVLSDLKSFYTNNNSKNEYIFNLLNSNVISNFSLSQKENLPQNQNQIQNENLKINKKSLKNNELSTSNINSLINENPIFKCTCKNSNCLKLYCECFANGKLCDNCFCTNYKNTQENKEIRLKKYKVIISKNPKAIQKINSSKKSWTCKCKNSNCQKKYCECFHNKRTCTSKCRCINCLNKNNGINKNNNEKKIKRIRGLKNEKIYKLLRKKNKDDITIKNDEIINDNKNEENIKNEIEIKNPLMKYYTPKKLLIHYQKETTTAALTENNEEKKTFENKTDKKRREVYKQLQMDI